MSLPTPNTRKEQYLNAIATGNAGGLPTPITREEEYLDAIAKSGGGGGEGDMKKSVYDSDLTVANAGGISAFVDDVVSGKVDKVEGKGLSENDYSDTEKGKVAANAEAIEELTEKVTSRPSLLYGIYSYDNHSYYIIIPYNDAQAGNITADMVDYIVISNVSTYNTNISVENLGNVLSVKSDDLPANSQYIGYICAIHLS